MPLVKERKAKERHAARPNRNRLIPSMSKNVISFSECRNHLAECFRRVSKPNEILFVTQNGRATTFLANVRDWDAFVEFCERRELLEDVAAAEAELDAGQGIPHEKVKREVAAKIEETFRELGI